ncbi:transglutaminase family protein [Sphingobium sp. CR28]|uniref:transglutaminase family protein n=1 Tax=Sphingobium sp. CR28 TaxID=3400272 RepID=UPI003FEE6D8A
MMYRVRHLTTVDYAGRVRLARFNVRLKPVSWPGQTLQDFSLTIDPQPSTMQEEFGPFMVSRSRLTIRDPLTRLSIETRFRVEVAQQSFMRDMMDGPTVSEIRRRALTHGDLSALGPASYLYASPLIGSSAEIGDWAQAYFSPDQTIVASARALMEAIHREFAYDAQATVIDTPPVDAFRQRRGVCQDFAHVMIAAARAHGIPAGYVSGYLRTIPPPGKARLVGADAMHAWANIWCGDDLGWIGFDPTNNALAQDDHIFVAMGRDYSDVAPLDGVFHGGVGQKMTVAVDVEPI